jgi:hypothetical protein
MQQLRVDELVSAQSNNDKLVEALKINTATANFWKFSSLR